MRALASLLVLASIAACGIETATTAATSAEIKRRELEAAKNTLKQATDKIEQNTQQLLQKAAQGEEKSKE